MGKQNKSKKDNANIIKNIEQSNEKLIVNGLHLPEKETKENLIQRAIYLKPKLYADLYKISMKLKTSMNQIHVLLAQQFVENNKHLL